MIVNPEARTIVERIYWVTVKNNAISEEKLKNFLKQLVEEDYTMLTELCSEHYVQMKKEVNQVSEVTEHYLSKLPIEFSEKIGLEHDELKKCSYASESMYVMIEKKSIFQKVLDKLNN